MYIISKEQIDRYQDADTLSKNFAVESDKVLADRDMLETADTLE